MNGRASAGP